LPVDVFSGIIGGLAVVGKNVAVGLIMIFVGIFFGAMAILNIALLVKVTRELWATPEDPTWGWLLWLPLNVVLFNY
jgi:hypothetical protein